MSAGPAEDRARRARGSRGARLRIAVATGTRAEFGLLEPVMRAVRGHESLELITLVAGAHFLKPSETWREVDAAFGVDARIPMQREGETGRLADAAALGRGVEGFARALADLRPDWVVVLGDRIEALAAASAASVGGAGVAHLHGGDRAEGVADEAMRHAITKLSHLHLPATAASSQRIIRMGEAPSRVRVVGSPAIDGLEAIDAMGDARYAALGSPDTLFLMHPVGRDAGAEETSAAAALRACAEAGRRTLALAPNFDPGREGVVRAIASSGVRALEHLPRREWVALMRRVAHEGGVLVGNSSAGLIEATALRPALPTVDIGPRQSGRERPACVVHAEAETTAAVLGAIREAVRMDRTAVAHPYGEGRAGVRAAEALAEAGRPDLSLLRKRNAY